MPGRNSLSLERAGKVAADFIKRMETKMDGRKCENSRTEKQFSSETEESRNAQEKANAGENGLAESKAKLLKDVKEEILSEEDEGNRKIDDESKRKVAAEATKKVKKEKQMPGQNLDGVEDISDLIVGEVKLEMKDSQDDLQTCRYCKEDFLSPVSLHQHERYLCHHNHDIQKAIGEVKPKSAEQGDDLSGGKTASDLDSKGIKEEHRSPSVASSSFSHSESEPEEDEDEDEDEEEDEEEEDEEEEETITEVHKSSKLVATLTENQVQHLRACYRDNQEPDEHSMEEIGKIIGATKIMVQVSCG